MSHFCQVKSKPRCEVCGTSHELCMVAKIKPASMSHAFILGQKEYRCQSHQLYLNCGYCGNYFDSAHLNPLEVAGLQVNLCRAHSQPKYCVDCKYWKLNGPGKFPVCHCDSGELSLSSISSLPDMKYFDQKIRRRSSPRRDGKSKSGRGLPRTSASPDLRRTAVIRHFETRDSLPRHESI